MGARVEGRVALITGAARGQGRSHAVRLAEEGADIVALDICEQIATAEHTMGTDADLRETARLVEQLGRRVFVKKVDVRDRAALDTAVEEGVAALGRLDIVSANAGIASTGPGVDLTTPQWQDMIDVNLTGVFHTAAATIPFIRAGGRGGSIVITSSVSGLSAPANLAHYNAAKHGVIGLMKTLALELAPEFIRVNAIAPTNVDTEMLVNDAVLKLFFPDREEPTRADAEAPGSPFVTLNALPIPWVDPIDISNALLYLASDEARYVTGITLPVDAGRLLK